MRSSYAAYRTPVVWEAKNGNAGDGSTYAPAKTIRGDVKAGRSVKPGPEGSTVTDPFVVQFPHRQGVKIGDRLTIGGQRAVVNVAEVVFGAFGVPHHLRVVAGGGGISP